ncbi:YIEGIA domain-containing protein, partial [Caldifermentibacillus hisashii]|uniref:YIEGIA domain-containing protein n=1 Tax=Caldifermentibacillus hisashii TaxID=996558 RepID=UPI003D256AEB
MNGNQILSFDEISIITTAVIMGTFGRVYLLKEDYRQYPSYPNGYLIHIIIGFVASALGAVAIPALLSKNYTAVTFLTVALQQFRDVRKMEKESLNDLENTEYTYRGNAYIDGIAKTFESRNYIAFITSFIVSLSITIFPFYLWINIITGIVLGLAITQLSHL